MKSRLVTISFLLVFILINCKDSTTGTEEEEEGKPEQITASIEIQEDTVRTFVTEEFTLEVTKNINPPDTFLSLVWSINNTDVAEIDTSGYLKVIGLGRAQVIASLYDSSDRLIASDTTQVFSEAKKVYESDGAVSWVYDTITENKNTSDFLISITTESTPYHRFLFSDNRGDTWIEKDLFDQDIQVLQLIRSEADQNLLALNYIDDNFLTNNGDIEATGILISEDDGLSWREVVYPYAEVENEEFEGFQQLGFSNTSRGLIYSLLRLRIHNKWPEDEVWRLYKSNDLGLSWSIVKDFNLGSATLPVMLVDRTDGDVVYISFNGSDNNFVTTDGGNTWLQWPKGQTVDIFTVSSIGTIYGHIFDNDSEFVVQSIDKALTWEKIFERTVEEKGIRLQDVSTLDEVIAILKWNFRSNTGHSVSVSSDNGQNWNEYFLKFNDRRTFANPLKINIVEVQDEYIDLLVYWNDDLDEFQISKIRFFYNLGEN